MKKTSILLFLLTGSMYLLPSCSKDKNTDRSSLLVGTWHLAAYGQDANMNGKLETSEHEAIPAGSDITEHFLSDHTGSVTITSGAVPNTTSFTWEFQQNDQQLLTMPLGGGATSTTAITLLTNHQLMGYDVNADPRIIILMEK